MAFSMIILSIAVFSTSIHALAFPGPHATSVSEKNEGMQHSGWTPRPTPGPKLPHELLKRQIAGQTVFVAPDRTCGFISGLPEAEFRCPETDSCVLFPTTGTGWGSVGCCNSESCGSRLACVDFDQYSTSSLCDIDCELDTAIQKCTDAETPYCNTVRFPLEGVQDYFCGTLSASTIQEALTTYDAETGRTVSTMIVSGSLKFSLHSASTAVAGSSTTSSAAASASETIHHGSTTTIISEGPSTKHPTTIIIGGVVGGAVAITLLSLVIFFFCRKRGTQATRKSSQTSSLSPPAYTIYGGQQELGTIVLSGAITHSAPTKNPKIRTSNG